MATEGPIAILGGGLSGLALAYFSGKRCTVFEKEERVGGLCRSFELNGVSYDVGPHILFSKDEQILAFMLGLSETNELRRSNKIFYGEGTLVKYPFENELSALDPADRDYCLNSFLQNPYATYPANSMATFFYKTFGEGITRLYLEPYNRKIWKFDPAFMDTQMVDRIPQPPREDIIASAEGRSTEGYLHQLFFHYPKQGGTESLIKSLVNRMRERVDLQTGAPVERVRKKRDGSWEVVAGGKSHFAPRVVSAMYVHTLLEVIEPAPPVAIREAAKKLLHNAIHVTVVQTREDRLGDNFALMVPDPRYCFHRLSKLDFLGDAYRRPGCSTLLVELTYRPGTQYDLPGDAISEWVLRDLDRAGLAPASACDAVVTQSFERAYVIYDLDHRRNTDAVLGWLREQGIQSAGRFATFEYINCDAAIAQAKKLAHAISDTPVS